MAIACFAFCIYLGGRESLGESVFLGLIASALAYTYAIPVFWIGVLAGSIFLLNKLGSML